MEIERELQIVEGSGYFDKDWHRQKYLKDKKNNPIIHYLQKGSKAGFDPSERFQTKYYLEQYEDVAKSNINPLVHYLLFGKSEGRFPRKHIVFKSDTSIKVDVVIPVYNTLEDVSKCLQSLSLKEDGVDLKIFVINDFSNKETSDFLSKFCGNKKQFILINN